MRVRIVKVPPGEAPEKVRRAWVGLVLPLADGHSGPVQVFTRGVLSGEMETDLPRMQYAVPVDAAVVLLERANPSAAAWWRENTPHMFGVGGNFGFPAHVCEEVP